MSFKDKDQQPRFMSSNERHQQLLYKEKIFLRLDFSKKLLSKVFDKEEFGKTTPSEILPSRPNSVYLNLQSAATKVRTKLKLPL